MKAHGQRSVYGRAEDIDGHGAHDSAWSAVDDAEAAPGQTGVDPEHPHNSSPDR
jgi:hypothetical protein